MLFCKDCEVEHDLDVFPDIGECMICGGWLVEHPDERVGTIGEGVVDAVTSGLAGVAIARGKAPRGAD